MRNMERTPSPRPPTKRAGLHPALEKKVRLLGTRIAVLQHKMETATSEQKIEALGRLTGLEQRHKHLEDQLRALDREGPGFRQDMKATMILLADDLTGAIEDLILSVDEHDHADRRASPRKP
jgi:predicted  nucleic acid-binding Zn-ribbon protein